MATNSTCVPHEVLAKAASEGYYERSQKKLVVCLFVPPMRGSRPGTLLSSGRREVQFQDIVIEVVHTNTIV